jgi:hypothetical protein
MGGVGGDLVWGGLSLGLIEFIKRFTSIGN